ncbi:FAD-dependent oxidoreductase [Ramlibacter humi]|nr:FAD-dependent monooxygenase [Ramlibacter humi]
MSLRIAIIGAGLGGLATALALQKSGFRPVVYERSPEFAPLGAGLTMCSNANRVLRHLGLGDMLERDGVTQAQDYRDARSGAVLRRFDRENDLKKYGAPYYKVHRGDLQMEMARLVMARDPDAVVMDSELESIAQHGTEVTLKFANGTEAAADLVIGADGIRSVVRQRLFDDSDPVFTGYVAWRALVPTEGLGEDFMVSAVTAGTDRMINRYLVRARKLINVVCFSRRSGWRSADWSTKSDLGEVFEEFGDFDQNTMETLRLIDPNGVYKWALHTRKPLQSWVSGRVVLLGDAVHPMLPFMGQGAAMAIEDGMILARCLGSIPVLDTALATYQAIRKPRAEELVERSNLMAGVFHNGPDKYTRASDYTDQPTDPSMYDATSVPLQLPN